MAVSSGKIEAWSPTELPTEEDLLLLEANTATTTTNTTTEFDPSCFPTEFPYEFDSASPTETDSSPDDHEEVDAFLVGLTRRLNQQLAFIPERKKREVAGSPESTLSGIGSCCWSVSVSSNGSPNGGPSPPTTPFAFQDDDTLDRIYGATGHVTRLKMGANNGLLGPVAVGPKSLQGPAGFYYSAQEGFSPNASAFYKKQHMGEQQEQVGKPQYSPVWPKAKQQVKPNWHHQPQKQQQQQQHIPFKLAATSTVFHQRSAGRSFLPLGLPQSAWPPLQPPQNLSDRSGYLTGGGPSPIGVKRERAGTGVFLPQPKLYYGNNSSINPKFSDSSKRKTGCSSVVVPAKVIQALNMNMQDRNENGLGLGHDHSRFHPSLGVSDYDLLVARRNAILAQQKRNLLRSDGLLNHVLRLPQD